jgi:predicted secreted hydrolase
VAATVSLAETMGGADTVGYARAFEPRPFTFPADHGPHPDFRTEWWYVTSNLEAADGRRFGVQFTIFRSALAPPADGSRPASPWRTRQMYLGHFTLTDVARGRFAEFERFTRGAAGLAGAWARDSEGAPVPPEGESGSAPRPPVVRIWLDDWQLASRERVSPSAPAPAAVGVDAPLGADPTWPLRLTAADSGVALDLTLDPLKPVVLQGERGLSQKGPEPGNASYYYSYPRLAAAGTVTVGGERVPVSGLAWMDREWSTSALGEGQQGWDWFSLQLSDGTELMVYQIRGAGGAASAESEGVWIDAAGAPTRLEAEDYTLTPTDRWASPVDGAEYPSGWRIAIPRLEMELEVEPVLRDQELNVTFRYWEGAVDVSGRRGAAELTGRGYVELTGYAGGTAGSAP